jgi:hypothetical protein
MSVQVKRRREAASFLGGFVGAPAELVVDTTNNRVQVHDGATPGGWPAAKLADVPGFAAGFVNKFGNGAMAVAQHGTAGTVAAGSTAATLDRWFVAATGAACAWSQPYGANIAGHALRLGAATGLTAVTLQQRVESLVAAAMLTAAGAAQAITVQFAVYNASGASLTAQLATGYATSQDNFGAITTDLAATNLQTIANGAFGVLAYSFVPSANLKNGYQIQLLLGGALNASSGYVDIGRADVRATPTLGPGLVGAAPLPELRPVATELAVCQRYFCKTFPQGVAPAQNCGTVAGAILYRAQYSGPDYAGAPWQFPVVMRAAPTLTYFNPSNANANWRNISLGADSGPMPVTATATSDRVASPLNLQVTGDLAGNFFVIHATASAEL